MTTGAGLIVARALLYGGALTALGRPAYLACAPLAARDRLIDRRWVRVCVAAAASLAFVAGAVHLLLLTAAMNGVAPDTVDCEMLHFVAVEMPVGRAALVRLVALMLVVGLAVLRDRLPLAGCIVGGTIAVASLAWNGHAMMHEGMTGWLHATLDQVHLVAGAVWLGGLVALVGLSRAEDAQTALARLEAFVAFSFIGTVVVATLLLTGILNAVLITGIGSGGAPAAVYLALLGVKIAAFLGMIGLAAHNRYHVAPALAAASPPPGLLGRARWSVTVELGLLLVIVAVVAVLGTLSPRAA